MQHSVLNRAAIEAAETTEVRPLNKPFALLGVTSVCTATKRQHMEPSAQLAPLRRTNSTKAKLKEW
jgi:hypothetical protein